MPNIQNLDISTAPAAEPVLLSTDEKKQLIEDLRIAVQTVKRSKIEVGRILATLRDGTEHGKWESLLETLCKDTNISRSTAHNYMEAYQETVFMPAPVVEACKEAGIDLDKTPARRKVAKALLDCPSATPAEVVAEVVEKPFVSASESAAKEIKKSIHTKTWDEMVGDTLWNEIDKLDSSWRMKVTRTALEYAYRLYKTTGIVSAEAAKAAVVDIAQLELKPNETTIKSTILDLTFKTYRAEGYPHYELTDAEKTAELHKLLNHHDCNHGEYVLVDVPLETQPEEVEE